MDDTASRPGDSDEAFDFFEQQDEVQPPTLGLSNKNVEKSLEEEEEEEEEIQTGPVLPCQEEKTGVSR